MSSSLPSAPRAQLPQKTHNHRKSAGFDSRTQQSSHIRSLNTNNHPRQQHHHQHSNTTTTTTTTMTRHQSMPPKQKDQTVITILKRTPAQPVVQMHPFPQQHHQQQQYQHQHQHQHQQRNQKQRPQSAQQPSKARRVQRRKDVDAVQESLAELDSDMALHQSPTLNPTSPPSSSSSDSSDSESTLARLSPLVQHRHPMSHRPTSAPAVVAPRHGAVAKANIGSFAVSTAADLSLRPHSGQKASNSAGNSPRQQEKNGLYAGPTFHNSPAAASLPIPAFLQGMTGNSSPVVMSEEKSSSTCSSTSSSPAPAFAEAASPQLNSARPQSLPQPQVQHQHSGWSGHQSMPVPTSHVHQMHQVPLPMAYHPHAHMMPMPMPMPMPMSTMPMAMPPMSMPMHPYQFHPHHMSMPMATYSSPAPQPHMGLQYNVPEHMATSSFSANTNTSRPDELSEISQSLRTLLKIQSQ
ncbi:hypothetical protein BGZ94_000151 [Podila epigama]|nr:hypothetical protein BGZ94_000151 [Podila epigama]